MELRRILVAVDFSPHSERALSAALALARRLGARIDLLHAYQVTVPVPPPDGLGLPETLLASVREAAGTQLTALAERVRREGLEVGVHLAAGPPAAEIARVARETGADLVVVGTRGRGGLAHVLLGSVAERTLRTAPCPVLSVPAPDAAEDGD